MKFLPGYTDPFLSPVTGRLRGEFALPDLPLGYVWMGGKDGRPVKTYKLIDHEIDIQFIKQHWREIADVIYFDKQTGDIKTKGSVEAKGVGVLDTLGQVARFVAPLVLASPYEMTLPAAPGTLNQVLSQGTGSQLEWKNIGSVLFDAPTLMDIVYGTLTNLNGDLAGFMSTRQNHEVKIKNSFFYGNTATAINTFSFLDRYDQGYSFQTTHDHAGHLFSLSQRTGNNQSPVFSFDSSKFSTHGYTIDDLPTPTAPLHAVNKAYVDGLAGGISSLYAGDGLAATPSNPITGAGTIYIPDQLPSPAGNHPFLNATINAKGFVTSASRGTPASTTQNGIPIFANTSGTYLLNTPITINTFGGEMSLSTYRITNLGDPYLPHHATNRNYVDGLWGDIQVTGTTINTKTWGSDIIIEPKNGGVSIFKGVIDIEPNNLGTGDCGIRFSSQYSTPSVYGGGGYLYVDGNDVLSFTDWVGDHEVYHSGSPVIAIGELWMSGDTITNAYGGSINIDPDGPGQTNLYGVIHIHNNLNVGTFDCGIRFDAQPSIPFVNTGGYLYVSPSGQLRFANPTGNYYVAG